MLAFGQTQAHTLLRNDGAGLLAYRLAAANPALTLDPEPAELAPGEEVELVVDVDLAALAPADRILPVRRPPAAALFFGRSSSTRYPRPATSAAP